MTPEQAAILVADDVRAAEAVLAATPTVVGPYVPMAELPSWADLLARAQAAAARAREDAKAKAKRVVAAARNAAVRLARGAQLAIKHDPIRRAAWKAVEVTTGAISLAVITPWLLLAAFLYTDTGRRVARRGAGIAAVRLGI